MVPTITTHASGLAPLALIVAYARNRVIGHDGKIPWHEPADLARFKRLTMGHAVIFGRISWQLIGKALPGRHTIVVSADPVFRAADGCTTVRDLPNALAAARANGDDLPFLCGGQRIYAEGLPLATHLFLTEIALEPVGDAWFPACDETDFLETACEEAGRCRHRTLERRPAPAQP
jgi:dihydrofolate reductase